MNFKIFAFALAAGLALISVGVYVALNAQPTVEQTGNKTVIEPTGEVKEFIIEAGNYYYSIEEIRVNEGDTVKIALRGVEGHHDWVIDEFGASTEHVDEGDTETVEFVADKKGEFEYYCSVGNHRALGQIGTLIVE